MGWPPSEKHLIVKRDALGRPLAPKPKRRVVQREAPIQKTMVEYLDLALIPSQVWWSATLNGVRLTKKQISEASALGLRKGLFDLVFVRLTGPAAGQTYHYEVKAPGGSLTAEQRVLLEVLSKAGRGASGKTLDHLYETLSDWGFALRCKP